MGPLGPYDIYAISKSRVFVICLEFKIDREMSASERSDESDKDEDG